LKFNNPIQLWLIPEIVSGTTNSPLEVTCGLWKSERPGRHLGSFSSKPEIEITVEEVETWVQSVKNCGIQSIICLLGEDELKHYKNDLIAHYQTNFDVVHIPTIDHEPISGEQFTKAKAAAAELPLPIVVHCSAGIIRSGLVVNEIKSITEGRYKRLADDDLPPALSSNPGGESITERLEIPALKRSVRHDRIAGYWQHHWVTQVKNGLDQLRQNNCAIQSEHPAIRLIIGRISGSPAATIIGDTMEKLGLPEGSDEIEGYEDAAKWLEILRERADEDLVTYLSELIGEGSLQIRFFTSGKKNPAPEHAKIQIYHDHFGGSAFTSGSKNDTLRGNYGGVDFLVLIRVDSEGPHPDARAQIEIAQGYFDKHWEQGTPLESITQIDMLKLFADLSALIETDKKDDSLLVFKNQIKFQEKPYYLVAGSEDEWSMFEETLPTEWSQSISDHFIRVPHFDQGKSTSLNKRTMLKLLFSIPNEVEKKELLKGIFVIGQRKDKISQAIINCLETNEDKPEHGIRFIDLQPGGEIWIA